MSEQGVIRDLDRERHVRAAAVWYCLCGGLVGLIGLAGLAFVLSTGAARGGPDGTGGIAVAGVFMASIPAFVAGVVLYALGHFTWRYHPVARWITVVVQTVIAAFVSASRCQFENVPSESFRRRSPIT